MIEFAVEKIKCLENLNNNWIEREIFIPKEAKINIFLNGEKFISILCTPLDIEDLVVGFLFGEEIINSYEDIEKIIINKENFDVFVTLKNGNFLQKNNLIYASGFGKGVFFEKKGKEVKADVKVKAGRLKKLMNDFLKELKIYKISGGIHASCLSSEDEIISIKEDIGRHNTIDKIIGECIRKKVKITNKFIFTTGRISTEMVLKSSKFNIPIIITKKTPTSNAVEFADKLNITIIGRAKDSSFIVFSKKERIMEV